MDGMRYWNAENSQEMLEMDKSSGGIQRVPTPPIATSTPNSWDPLIKWIVTKGVSLDSPTMNPNQQFTIHH